MPHRSRSALLSRRQFECLQGVADHLDSVQIAGRLGISEHTVNSHLTAAIAALAATSRRDAVRRYLTLQAEHPEKLTGQFLRLPNDPLPTTPKAEPATVQEVPAPFEERARPPTTAAHLGARSDDLAGSLLTLGIILAIAVFVVMLILAVDPLAQSAMRLANLIQPYHH